MILICFFKERRQDSPSYNKLLLIFFLFCSNQLVHSTFSAHCTRTAQSGLLTSRYENAICKCNASILVANRYIQFIWYCQLVAISETFQEGVLGHVSRKFRKLFGPEKPFVKLRLAYSVKLVFSDAVKRIKIKITSKFRASRRFRFEDTKRTMSPEMRLKSFGTFEKRAPLSFVSLCQLCYKRPCLSSFFTDSVIDDFITVAVTECCPLCDSSCRLLVFWKKVVPTFWDHLVCWQNPLEGLIN